MKTTDNIGKAKLLLELQPIGVLPPSAIIPWVVKVLVFLLYRYIRND